MLLNDLLGNVGIDPARTLVLRHKPMEPQLARALPLIASERPRLFNIFQSYQGPSVERSMLALRGGWLASFIAYGPAKAAFVGIYEIRDAEPHTRDQFWACSENQALAEHGYCGFTDAETRTHQMRFDLRETGHFANWRGKLIVGWPPPERGWYRRAHNNKMPVLAVREESTFAPPLPPWDEVEFAWPELAILPQRWRSALEQWRGIYAIWDSTDAKTYVGSAYGNTNILGRWLSYRTTGHGGNRLLRDRDPVAFRFTILQRVSPDMLAEEVIRLEASWKTRLHTRAPHGLNEN
jgi:hypothetical protein